MINLLFAIFSAGTKFSKRHNHNCFVLRILTLVLSGFKERLADTGHEFNFIRLWNFQASNNSASLCAVKSLSKAEMPRVFT